MFYHIKKITNLCGIFIYSIFLIYNKCCDSKRPLCCGDTYKDYSVTSKTDSYPSS